MSSAWDPSLDKWRDGFPIKGDFRAKPDGYVTAVSRSENNIDLFTTNPDGLIKSAAWNPEHRWNGWWSINDASAESQIHAVSRAHDKLDIFFISPEGVVRTSAWEPTFSNWHGPWNLEV